LRRFRRFTQVFRLLDYAFRNVFGGGGLDRAAHRRADSAWMAAARCDAKARVLLSWRSRFWLRPAGSGLEPVFQAANALDWEALAAHDWAFLGLDAAGAIFALDLSADEEPHLIDGLLPRAAAADWFDLRQAGRVMSVDEAAMLAYARGLFHWHARHRFCPVCGSPSEARDAGARRQCLNAACAAVQFPRTDPAVIMLVTHGDRCLLGRSPRFPVAIYSTLAGFVEPGESLEDAVAREVMEEAGVRVGTVRYHSSQPWPFPASLMVGFLAEAVDERIAIDGEELIDARWFTRAEVREAALLSNNDPFRTQPQDVPEGKFLIPAPISISRALIDRWLAGESGRA
jgi:NAD+ diphosphatase